MEVSPTFILATAVCHSYKQTVVIKNFWELMSFIINIIIIKYIKFSPAHQN